MSENSNVVVQKGTSRTVSRALIIQMMAENFERLPELDRKIFTYGPMYLGGNGAFAGLIANSLYRRALNVTQGRFTSNLPMAVLPFLTTVAMYNVAVSKPLLSGECLIVPVAVEVCSTLCSRMYNTTPLPEKGNVLRFWMNITQPILRKMGVVIVLQVFFGTYLSSRHFDSYLKLIQLSTTNGEELQD
uniref:Transmembrane protein 126A n=1 Tax=Oncorhynchus kisutch TaxID=8019 RepID=A0A8C7IT82_ONCKI